MRISTTRGKEIIWNTYMYWHCIHIVASLLILIHSRLQIIKIMDEEMQEIPDPVGGNVGNPGLLMVLD